jgi:hypothetical protein
VHFREISSGYPLLSRFDWSIFAKHMKEIINQNTRLLVRAKIFCCNRNGALSKKLHCYRKKSKLKKIDAS